MKQPIVWTGSLLLAWSGVLHASDVKGSGKIVEEKREVGAFSEVSVSAGIHASIVPGEKASVTVKADDNILPLVETKVSSGELELRLKKSSSVQTTQAIQVTIVVPEIKKLEASGGSHVSLTAAAKGNFSLESSGGSQISIKELNVKELDIDSSGGSQINVEGKADKLKFDGSGASKLQANSLDVGDVSVEASGASQVHVTRSPKVTGDISGASRIYTSKAAKTDVSKSGAAEVVVE